MSEPQVTIGVAYRYENEEQQLIRNANRWEIIPTYINTTIWQATGFLINNSGERILFYSNPVTQNQGTIIKKDTVNSFGIKTGEVWRLQAPSYNNPNSTDVALGTFGEYKDNWWLENWYRIWSQPGIRSLYFSSSARVSIYPDTASITFWHRANGTPRYTLNIYRDDSLLFSRTDDNRPIQVFLKKVRLKCFGKTRGRLEFNRRTPDVFNLYLYSHVNGSLYASYTGIRPKNGGSLTWEWREEPAKIQYIFLGTFVSGSYAPPRGDCGAIGHFMSYGFIWGNELDKPLEYRSEDIRVFGIRSLLNPINPSEGDRFIAARVIPESVYDSWRDNGNGWRVNTDFAEVLKVDECLPDNAIQYSYVRGLSAQITDTFRLINSASWQVIVKENGQEIWRSPYIVGSGENNWEEPDENRARIVFTESRNPRLTTNFNKRSDTGIEIENRPRDDIFTGYIVFYNQRDLEGNIIDSRKLIDTMGGIPAPEVEVICIGCPTNTCEVDCGDRICCYGADGIALDFYYK